MTADTAWMAPHNRRKIPVGNFSSSSPAPRHYSLIICGFHIGMKKGELIGLRWDRMDLGDRAIHVVDNIVWGRKTTPKNRIGRLAHMTSHLSEVLREYRRDREEEDREKI